jgi:hypothetical protein
VIKQLEEVESQNTPWIGVVDRINHDSCNTNTGHPFSTHFLLPLDLFMPLAFFENIQQVAIFRDIDLQFL